MTLQQFNPKLNDLSNRPLVVVFSFVLLSFISVTTYLVNDNKNNVATATAEKRVLQLKIDSMNREQIILYRDMALGVKENKELKQEINKTDSILRQKTELPMLKILKNSKK